MNKDWKDEISEIEAIEFGFTLFFVATLLIIIATAVTLLTK